MFLSSDFWPLFWLMLGAGLMASALLGLLIATVRPSRRHQPPAELEGAPRYDGETSGHALAA